MFGSFPKASYQSFLCLILSHSISQCWADLFTLCEQEGLPAVPTAPLRRLTRGTSVPGPSTCGTKPSSQMEKEDMVRRSVFQPLWQPQCFLPSLDWEEKDIRVAWAFVSCKARTAAAEGLHSCTSATYESILLFPPLSVFLWLISDCSESCFSPGHNTHSLL